MTKYVLFTLVLTLALMLGCTDRGSNSPTPYNGDSGIHRKGGGGHVFFNETLVQIKNSSPFQHKFYLTGYDPYVQEWGGLFYQPPSRLPVLLLLPPENGDEFYYFQHGLAQVANELLTEGLIEPMFIVTLGNDGTFDGFWYGGDGGGSGNYDTLVGGTLMTFIWNEFYQKEWVDSSQGMTGIGGIGQGAYGAFRAAMKHPGRFGSISVVDGPLDFDGADGASGLIDLMDDAIIEQGLPLGSATYTQEWDSVSAYRISRMFIGGACAFSPHDTVVNPVITVQANGNTIVSAPDSVRIDNVWYQRRWKIQGAHTLVENLVQDYNFDFHLPFDEFGQPYSTADEPIWDLWMRNSLDKMYHAYHRSGNDFSDVNLWFATSTENDPLGYNKMTQAFIQLLRGYGYDPEVNFVTGYEGNPNLGDEYLNHLLRQMLIFHSNSFQAAQEAQSGK